MICSMRIGFTGTQRGMAKPQFGAFVRELAGLVTDPYETEFHHGDCIGADAQAHDAADAMSLWTVKHPPLNTSKQANKVTKATNPRLPYLVRNKNIVIDTEVLIGTPGEMEEQLRSGTWSTIRFARNMKKAVKIIYPDGSIR